MRRRTTAIIAVALMLAACGGPERDEAGEIVAESELSAFAIQLGDCIVMPEADEVSDVTGVPCDEPHDAQAYYLFDIAGDEYPGVNAVVAEADETCYDEYEGFVGVDYISSEYYSTSLYPSVESWAGGDREVICLVVTQTFEPFTGDLRGSGL